MTSIDSNNDKDEFKTSSPSKKCIVCHITQVHYKGNAEAKFINDNSWIISQEMISNLVAHLNKKE